MSGSIEECFKGSLEAKALRGLTEPGSRAFSLIGGGDTLLAIENLESIKTDSLT